MDREQKQRTGTANRSPEQQRETEQRNKIKKHEQRTGADSRDREQKQRTGEANRSQNRRGKLSRGTKLKNRSSEQEQRTCTGSRSR